MSQKFDVRIKFQDPKPIGVSPVILINDRGVLITPAQRKVLMAFSSLQSQEILTTDQAFAAAPWTIPGSDPTDLLCCFRNVAEQIRRLINQLCPEQYQGFVCCMNPGYRLAEGVSIQVIKAHLI